ncbi:hypothetical protein ACIQYS_18000 [Psychrobacillus sp. NPDC096426]|uniref:hypothetical protein n=1 Tax=Psychrobacillus sp. NPDC096426 TaxID=3364491 RepID=UPI00380EF16B
MREKNMKTVLDSLKNMKIRLYLEGSQFVEGVLLNVKQDYLVVDVGGKLCYFTLDHIQALSNNAKNFHIFPKNDVDLNNNDLIGVLKELKYNWVTINSLSDQELFGVLSNIFEDSIIVINQQELHYIAKSHISNIHKGISEKEKNITSSKEKLNVEKTTANMELNQVMEKATEISQEETIQDVISSWIEEINEPVNSKDEVEKYLPQEQMVSDVKDETNSNELEKLNGDHEDPNFNGIKQLLEHLNSIGQFKVAEQSTEIRKEITIQDAISSLIKEINELDDSKEEVEKYLPQKRVVSDINESIAQKIEPIHASLEEIIEGSNLDVVADSTTNKLKVEKIMQTEPPVRKNEKRILLTPWSKMNYDQNAIAIAPKKDKESSNNIGELPLKKTQLLLDKEQDLPATNEALEQEELNIEMKSPEPIEIVATKTTLISPRERKAMLEKQYYALMRHAEQSSTNLEHQIATIKSFHPSPLENEANNDLDSGELQKIRVQERKKGEKAMLEKQFNSLMRHAAKMYRQLRDY